ncbi:MAG: glycosyltransferase family 4 protein [Deltaproteobacteria bacterium]|nr:glycosyltransferase family 4 protein [Deltaproteobacteria bacterium]
MVSITQVDTSPRWRAIDDLAVWKRVIGGGMQLLRDYGIFLKAVCGADVVHLTTSGRLATVRDIAICTTARLLKVPVVYHLHFGRIPEIARAGTREWRFLTKAMKLADIVLAIDNATANTVRKYLPGLRVETAPNPIGLDVLPVPVVSQSEKKTALFLGWVLPTKGVEELLQAWTACALDTWELVLAGPYNPAYHDMLVSRYQSGSMCFVGELPNDEAMRLLAGCDLFILPSHTEAFPYVVLEAMTLGKPIIATQVGAIPEMLAGGCGEIVAAKDVGALAAALTKLMTHESLRDNLGSRAYEKAVSCYSLAVVMKSISALWKQLAAR